MLYLLYAIIAALAVTLVAMGHWQYVLGSIAMFVVITVPFIIKARKIPTGNSRVKTILGAVALLALFIVVMFVAAIALNFVYWRLFHASLVLFAVIC